MEYRQHCIRVAPRLIIHGGAGNILPSNLPPATYKRYRDSLLRIVADTWIFLNTPASFPLSSTGSPRGSRSHDHVTALDAVIYAVTLLEDNPLFNSGHGAVFTRDGTNELEASVMVSRGKKKRGVGVMGIRHVKNPIKLAREILLRGEDDLEGGNGEHRGPMSEASRIPLLAESGGYSSSSRGAQAHCQLFGESAERLAREWGMEMVDPDYYFVQARWDEHMKGLKNEQQHRGLATWDKDEYFPQGTCGAVALDADGVLACATSTGGITNKLPGRIGDTPTLGAGFWAEEWEDKHAAAMLGLSRQQAPILQLSDSLRGLLSDCLPSLHAYQPIVLGDYGLDEKACQGARRGHSTALSGTGNGDSMLRTNAVRTAAAIAKYRNAKSSNPTTVQEGVDEIFGAAGELQLSAGDRWARTGEGEGGVAGIELDITRDPEGNIVEYRSSFVEQYNCGGMFRAVINDRGKAVARVWRPGQYPDLEKYQEDMEHVVQDWASK